MSLMLQDRKPNHFPPKKELIGSLNYLAAIARYDVSFAGDLAQCLDTRRSVAGWVFTLAGSSTSG